ncbi:V-type ATP synthase subunit I [Streptococcus massiliensis]|uniref:V-type ATP synthase subunit I n=1 Tax=Streptococcus massiliensis TaxID=313439 RepID=A0A380KWY0_9STRE|nr:V-type ATP synthase subunit I [Streptococcus massiliensis]SUN76061.1 V-type ATP synthase subunit I [Streptococcus massiliensis]
MAVSSMQAISLILPADELDDVLRFLQSQQSVQIHELKEDKEWFAAFDNELVHNPMIEQVEEGTERKLQGEEALQYLLKRQQQLEQAISQLESYLPKSSVFQSLRKLPRQMSFEELEMSAQASDEKAILKQISENLHTLNQAKNTQKELQAELGQLEKWSSLEITPNDLKRLKYINAAVGTIPNNRDGDPSSILLNDSNLEVEEVFQTETELGFIIFSKLRDNDAFFKRLETYHFKEFDYSHEDLPKVRCEVLRQQIKSEKDKAQAALTQLQTASAELDTLKLRLDYMLNAYRRQLSKKNLASTRYLVALEGWIEADQVGTLQETLQAVFGARISLQTRELSEEEQGQAPIKLHNPALVEPFELVTEMYALPKYHEQDPTPIVAVFYFVFFGMMVADLGYGLLMMLATSFALHFLHFSPKVEKNLRLFRTLSLAVAIWGVIYGSFLGFELPFVLIRTSTDTMTILLISIIFGFITVLVGLFLAGLKNVRVKDYAEAYNSGFAWVLILFGLMLFAVGKLLSGFAFLVPIGQWLALVNAIAILVVSIISAKSLTGLGSGLYNLYGVSSYVGDLVSFTRLMALGLSGASIGTAFNVIVNLFPPLARFSIGILIFILLHSINLFLSILSGYVHGARLMFVEFFGKFYEGGGKAFHPLKPAEKYIKIIKEENKMKT